VFGGEDSDGAGSVGRVNAAMLRKCQRNPLPIKPLSRQTYQQLFVYRVVPHRGTSICWRSRESKK